MLRILANETVLSSTVPYSDHQQKSLLIIQFCSGCLSVIGSSLILYLVWKSPNSSHTKRRHGRLQRGNGTKLPFERIMIGLSISDLLHSLRCMTMDIPVPRDIPGTQFAFGNQASCSAQGFFAQLSIIGLYYSTSLSIYFVLCINPNIDDNTIKQRYEPFLHAIPIMFSILSAFVGLFLGMNNPSPSGQECWLAPSPFGCDNDHDYTDCTRGKHARLLVMYSVATGWVCFLIIVCCMISIYTISWRQQRKMDLNYSSSFSETMQRRSSIFRSNKNTEFTQGNKNKLRCIAIQAFLYISVVFFTWIWSFINIILMDGWRNKAVFGISVLEKFFLPLQGFLNLLIYIRPCFINYRRKNPTASPFFAIQYIFTGNSSLGNVENSLSNQQPLPNTCQNVVPIEVLHPEIRDFESGSTFGSDTSNTKPSLSTLKNSVAETGLIEDTTQ
jgi:hypothetical protein